MNRRFKELSLHFLPRGFLQLVKKRYYVRKLRRSAFDEEREMAVIRRLVMPGDSVIDIGANYGMYTMFFSSLVGDRGKVYAFEPVPATCDILEYERLKLGKRNIEIMRNAVSDENGDVVVEVPRYETGGENYYRARINPGMAAGNRVFRVPSKTLDSLFFSYPGRLTFIKCDTEGHELKCIMGAMRMIRKFRPALMIELGYDPRKVPFERQILGLLAGEGYGVYKLKQGRLTRDYLERGEDINYFFLQEKHAAAALASG